MNERLYLTTKGLITIEPIEELSRVSLREDVESEDGRLPAGSNGTVVLVHSSGEAYIVEFDAPFHALVTVDCNLVEPIAGESRADLVATSIAADRRP